MSEPLLSPRAQSAISRIGRNDALSRVGELDHPFDLRGRLLLVGKGSHEDAVADGAIAALGRQPSVPRARDPLRRPPPLLKLLLSLLQPRLGNPRVPVVGGAGPVLRGSASSRTEEHVPDYELTATSIPRAQSAPEIRLPYAISP